MLMITRAHLDPNKPPKRIGRIRGVPVFELVTKGGLNLVICKNDGNGPRILGAAPHRALARYMAQQKDPDFQLEELSKSEDQSIIQAGMHLVPYFTALVSQMNMKMEE